ncbi:MAG TPA: tetratricopeptide repeat protein [Pirellulaceae bacterium]|nr:tetratricopeptide repeat protein [Pirellulaceae bacterium]
MSKRQARSNKQRSSYLRRKPLPVLHKSGPASDSPRTASAETDQRVAQWISAGIDAIRAGRYADAQTHLQDAARAEPENPLVHNCLGITYRALGQPQEAIRSYERAFAAKPDYFEAYNNLGIVYEASGNHAAAANAYKKAIELKPDFAAAFNNLGNVLTKQGSYAEAAANLLEAQRLQPNFVAAINNRGLALRSLGRLSEAEESFRQVIRLQPGFAEAYVNLGNVFVTTNRLDQAEECFRLAVRSRPQFALAHGGLGSALLKQGRADEACRCYEKALEIDATFADASFGLGNACKELGRLTQAVSAYERAVAHQPQHAEAFNNLGNVLGMMGKIEEATRCFEKAVSAKPDYLVAHNNLGNLYRLQDRLEAAAVCYQRVLSNQPYHPLHQLRISSLCPTVFGSRDEMAHYLGKVRREWTSLAGACQYSSLDELIAVANEPPYNLQFFDENIRDVKQSYASIFQQRGAATPPIASKDRIHIGLVITKQHEIAFLRLIWDALKQMDADEFPLTILCTASAASKFRAAVRGRADVQPLAERTSDMVAAIRAANFDVLYYFEIGTDVLNYFLPFFRLAPVQCASWGIQVTSGIPNVDYYLSSRLVEPNDGQQHYSEQLVQADTLLAYQTPICVPENAKTRESFGFTADQHLYMCIQHLGKFHPDFDPILGELLRRDPRGRVVATTDRYGHGAQRLRERLLRTIPDVADRVVFLGKQSLPDYLSLLACGDVSIDAPHFSGVNTTYDALALDIPIVTMPSGFHRGRYTYGCYQRMEMMDCVASSREEYVDIATRLGMDEAYREWIRGKIQATKHLVFRDNMAVSEHERIFRELIEKARSQ